MTAPQMVPIAPEHWLLTVQMQIHAGFDTPVNVSCKKGQARHATAEAARFFCFVIRVIPLSYCGIIIQGDQPGNKT